MNVEIRIREILENDVIERNFQTWKWQGKENETIEVSNTVHQLKKEYPELKNIILQCVNLFNRFDYGIMYGKYENYSFGNEKGLYETEFGRVMIVRNQEQQPFVIFYVEKMFRGII